jgi:flagellin
MRLSSGTTFVGGGDDPAGQATASAYTSTNGLVNAALSNVQNSLSYTQTADGDLGSIQGILTRMSQLATLASAPTTGSGGQADYQSEFSSLQSELRSIIGGPTTAIGGTADVTSPQGTFDGLMLFGGGSSQVVESGTSPSDNITLPQLNLQQGATAAVINQDSSGNFTLSLADPSAASTLSGAIAQVGTAQSQNGDAALRLQIAATRLQVESQNLTSAISNISDTDVASQSTQLARFSILEQAGTAMLAQANANSSVVFRLLKQN